MQRGLGPLVVTYHGVADVPLLDDPYGLFTSPAALSRHIERIRSWGYQFVTFGELAARAGSCPGGAEGFVALTFDDGLANLRDQLSPILEANAIPATIFVVSSWIGRQHPDATGERILSTTDLVAMDASPLVEVGSHSATHRDLTQLTYDEVVA